jgi:hypothetical protein
VDEPAGLRKLLASWININAAAYGVQCFNGEDSRSARTLRFTHCVSWVTAPRIKRVAQQTVEVVNRQGQLAIGLSRFFVQFTLLQALSHAPEARVQGEPLISIPQLAEQTAHSLGSFVSGADYPQSGWRFSATRLDALQQDTLKLAAILGAVCVNTAAATLESGARLSEVPGAQCGTGGGNRQAESLQLRGIIGRLQADVGKNNAIAAQAAGHAKLLFNHSL